VLATGIWSSSFVVSQVGLRHLGPFTVVGLQYLVAFVALAPFAARDVRAARRAVPRRVWVQLVALGLTAYVVGNGTLIWGLKWIPAATAALLLSSSPLLVMLGSRLWLKEPPAGEQIAGVLLTVVGGVLFFLHGISGSEPLGVGIVAAGVLAFCAFSLIGRDVARDRKVSPLLLTGVPFGVAGAVLSATALASEGWPTVSWPVVGVLAWLGLVDTAVAYALYNRALERLTATEMSAVISLTPLGTAALGWAWLGQALRPAQLVGMAGVIAGVLFIECRPFERVTISARSSAVSAHDENGLLTRKS
jgi:drug/metabolite transporter (DMT)-like permease